MHSHILATALQVACGPGNIPCPGTGSIPSAGLAAKLNTILSWIAWVATAACVVGILIVGATMAIQHQRGRASEHMVGLMWVLVGCILIGTASSLVGVFA